MKRSTLSMVAAAAVVPLMATSVAAVAPRTPALPQPTSSASVATATPSMSITGSTDLQQAADWAKADEVRQAERAARSNGLRTYGTSFNATQAVSRLLSWARSGTAGYPDQCLRLADDAYGATARTSTALAQWSRARAAGVGNPDSKDIPVGAQMFWQTSNPAGHIATYVGDGKVVTNMPGGSIEIVNWHKLNDWGPYLGWANPYYR